MNTLNSKWNYLDEILAWQVTHTSKRPTQHRTVSKHSERMPAANPLPASKPLQRHRQPLQQIQQSNAIHSNAPVSKPLLLHESRDVYLLSICVWEAFSNKFSACVFLSFLKQHFYLYVYFLVEKKAIINTNNNILFQQIKFRWSLNVSRVNIITVFPRL